MINDIEIEVIKDALLKVKPGLEKYIKIRNELYKVNVEEEREFQKLYNGFYRMRQRKAEFYDIYYDYLEKNKYETVSFENVIRYIYEKTGRVEPSFSSKLLANIDTNKPIWDSVVLNNLNIEKPKPYKKKEVRLEECIKVYELLEMKYDQILANENTNRLINLFDKTYKDTGISDMKKVDFILWQIRS